MEGEFFVNELNKREAIQRLVQRYMYIIFMKNFLGKVKNRKFNFLPQLCHHFPPVHKYDEYLFSSAAFKARRREIERAKLIA